MFSLPASHPFFRTSCEMRLTRLARSLLLPALLGVSLLQSTVGLYAEQTAGELVKNGDFESSSFSQFIFLRPGMNDLPSWEVLTLSQGLGTEILGTRRTPDQCVQLATGGAADGSTGELAQELHTEAGRTYTIKLDAMLRDPVEAQPLIFGQATVQFGREVFTLKIPAEAEARQRFIPFSFQTQPAVAARTLLSIKASSQVGRVLIDNVSVLPAEARAANTTAASPGTAPRTSLSNPALNQSELTSNQVLDNDLFPGSLRPTLNLSLPERVLRPIATQLGQDTLNILPFAPVRFAKAESGPEISVGWHLRVATSRPSTLRFGASGILLAKSDHLQLAPVLGLQLSQPETPAQITRFDYAGVFSARLPENASSAAVESATVLASGLPNQGGTASPALRLSLRDAKTGQLLVSRDSVALTGELTRLTVAINERKWAVLDPVTLAPGPFDQLPPTTLNALGWHVSVFSIRAIEVNPSAPLFRFAGHELTYSTIP